MQAQSARAASLPLTKGHPPDQSTAPAAAAAEPVTTATTVIAESDAPPSVPPPPLPVAAEDGPADTTPTPTLKHVQRAYFVRRNSNGNLPVYTDIRNGGTRYLVLIRNVEGSVDVRPVSLISPAFRSPVLT